MKLIIDIPEEQYNLIKLSDKSVFADASSKECMLNSIKNGIPYDEKLQVADEVWKLYEKHHSHLATHVIEFGNELNDLLVKYQKEGEE